MRQSNNACQKTKYAQHISSHYCILWGLVAEMNISSHGHLYRNLHLKVIAIDHNWLIRCSQLLRPFSDFNYMIEPGFQRANLCKKKCNLSFMKYQGRKCYPYFTSSQTSYCLLCRNHPLPQGEFSTCELHKLCSCKLCRCKSWSWPQICIICSNYSTNRFFKLVILFY